MKIIRRRKPVTKEEAIRIATDYNGEMSIQAILERYGISHQTLYNVLKRLESEEHAKTQ